MGTGFFFKFSDILLTIPFFILNWYEIRCASWDVWWPLKMGISWINLSQYLTATTTIRSSSWAIRLMLDQYTRSSITVSYLCQFTLFKTDIAGRYRQHHTHHQWQTRPVLIRATVDQGWTLHHRQNSSPGETFSWSVTPNAAYSRQFLLALRLWITKSDNWIIFLSITVWL